MAKRSADAAFAQLRLVEESSSAVQQNGTSQELSLVPFEKTPDAFSPLPLNSYAPKKKRRPRVPKKDTINTAEWKAAEAIRSSLGSDQQSQSFTCYMYQSTVGGGFSLGVPTSFCARNMPADTHCEVILVGEHRGEKTWTVKYLFDKKALSAGWKRFSEEHGLEEGDVLVFHLIERFPSHKMKVYIVRKNERANREASDPTATAGHRMDHEEDESKTWTDESLDRSSGSGARNGIKLSASNISLKEIQSFKDFNILYDGLAIDSEFSRDTRLKYYALCQSQNLYLHQHLLPGISPKFAAGAIIEIVSIADAINAASLTTPKENVEVWMKTLMAVELLGMRVGFLRERLIRQTGLVSSAGPSKYETTDGRDKLQALLLEMQETARKYYEELEATRKSKQ